MNPDKPRYLLVVVCVIPIGSFLLLAGISLAGAEPATTPTLDASAWSFLPVVRGVVQGPPAPTSTELPPPDPRYVILTPTPDPAGTPANSATATAAAAATSAAQLPANLAVGGEGRE